MPAVIFAVIAALLFGGVFIANNTAGDIISPTTLSEITPISDTSPEIVPVSAILTQKAVITPLSSNTPIPTMKPSYAPKPFVRPTSIPISPFIPPQDTPLIQQNGSFNCNCSKTCDEMASCDEAYYQLNNCSCSRRDGDNDGVPCENICP